MGGLTPFQVDAIADELYSRDDLLGRYIRWALLYTRNRYELAEELDQLHGKVGQKSRIVLMTPAIVDFSKWLEDEDQLSIGRFWPLSASLWRSDRFCPCPHEKCPYHRHSS